MFTSRGDDHDDDEHDNNQRKKMRYSSSDSSDVETDKLKVTVLSFNNIQFTNDDIDSDDEDADHNNVNYMKFRRIRSVDVGIRPVPSRHETVRAIIQPSSTSYLYPSSEGYVASLSSDKKEMVYYQDKQDRSNEAGVAFHWGGAATNRTQPIRPCRQYHKTKYSESEYRNCATTPHVEIERQLDGGDYRTTVIDFQVCLTVHKEITEGGGLSVPSYACLHGFGQLKITWAELDMLMLDDAPVPAGLVARVSITKRKAPSWFSKRNTTKEEGLRFSRGSSLVVKIEREESLEKEQLKQRVWKEIAERKASQQMSGGVSSSSIVDARPASRALPNNSGPSSAHQQLDGAIEEMQPSLLPKNVELHSQECKQHQSLDVHSIQRNEKENVDNCQQKMSINELYVSKAHQLSEPTKQVHHLPRQGKSVVCDITTTQKAPPQDEVQNLSMDVASLSVPSIPQSVQNEHHQHHPQKVHQQSGSTKETGENFQRGEQEMMNCFASAPVVSTSQEVSDSLFGVTTVQVAKLNPHQEEEQQQLDSHGFQSSIENNGTTASDIDIGKERECASGGEQSKQDDQVQIRERERKIEESKDDLYKIRMDAVRMDEEMLVQYRALLDALPRPDAVASLPVQTQLSIIRQITMIQMDLHDYVSFFRESRARIDIEYEEQLGRMQRLMASYLCNDIMMRANNKQVTSNDEEVAKK